MAKKQVVRVHFMDDSCKAFAIDENATTDELRAIVIEKLELKEDSCFALFEKRDDWERCLDGDEKPSEIMQEWGDNQNGAKVKSENPPTFVFKKKIFLRDDDREMEDEVAKHLLYIQARRSVLQSEYPCGVDEAIQLGGLQVQETYGDHNPAVHVVGFLSNTLKQFVPKHLLPTKRSQEWEQLLFKAHATHVGKSGEDAQTEYLEIVKQWPYYGTTFFPACRSVSNRKLPNKVVVGVNAEGIILLKPKDKELISTHPFTEICSWASSSNTFAFEFGSQNESQKYTFETRHGAIIASTIQTYIDILVQMLKNVEDISEDDD